ncbi:MAG: Trm112 family protein [Candidatus Omnitrophica bacterium]|nr:Trm112 family protein [Candidatus Omnitrophota bacterium]
MATHRTRRNYNSMDKDLLDILACPETKKSLVLADEETVAKVNAGIEAGKIFNKEKVKVTEKIDGGLFREGDQRSLYPIRDNIPILLVEELILLDNLEQ